LVASLKAELDVQRKLGLQSRGLQKQLKDRDDELARLKSGADESQAQLASAQSEVKALQTKLAAARNTAASLEGAAKVPGSAIKGGAANRANAAATAEAAQASQLAQLKEDLYSDLTGLIVRDVKNRELDYLYDCIQTGINGSKLLHFQAIHGIFLTSLQLSTSILLCQRPRLITTKLNSNTCLIWTPTAIATWSTCYQTS
jgi:hypothetical protein